jgi:hypothetical protein
VEPSEQSAVTLHSTQSPVALHTVPPSSLQAPPSGAGVALSGTPAMQVSTVQSRMSSGRSVLSGWLAVAPAPSQMASWQFPGLCAGRGVPWATFSVPQTPLVQVAATQSVAPVQSPGSVHMLPPVPPWPPWPPMPPSPWPPMPPPVVASPPVPPNPPTPPPPAPSGIRLRSGTAMSSQPAAENRPTVVTAAAARREAFRRFMEWLSLGGGEAAARPRS